MTYKYISKIFYCNLNSIVYIVFSKYRISLNIIPINYILDNYLIKICIIFYILSITYKLKKLDSSK